MALKTPVRFPGVRFRLPLRVRFRDLDPYAHVNHAVYFSYFEEARAAYVERLVGPLDRTKPFPFLIAHVEADFKRPLGFGDDIVVACDVTRIGRTSCEIEYEIRSPGGDLVATGRTVQVFVGADGRPTEVPESFRKAVESFARSP